MSKNKNVLLIGLTAVILFVGGTSYAIAENLDERGTEQAGTETVTRCSGGADEGVNKVTNDLPTIINEGAFVALANAAIGASVPTGDSDLFQIVFHGEAELENASTSSPGFNNDDRLEIQAVRVGGGGTALLPPIGPISFAGSNDQESHAASWCVRLPAGTWDIRIELRVVDVAPLSTVRAQLDDWELEVRRYN